MDDVEAMAWNMARQSAEEFANAPGAIDILRNGGWEGDIQSTILRRLGRMERILGIVEGQHHDVTRIDVVAHPVQGGLPHFALELKVNYAQQGVPMTSKGRLDACNKLRGLLVQQVPCFLIYTVADLWINGDADPYVVRHNAIVPNDYKKFHPHPLINEIDMAEILGQRTIPILLPIDHLKMSSARVRLLVWLSRVRQNANGYTLTPMHEDGASGGLVNVPVAPAAAV